jgi:hypothetical protein
MKIIDKFVGEFEFLSNFSYVPGGIRLEDDNFRYRDVERAYQASKTFNLDQRIEIRDATTPGKAKRLGRLTTLRSDWNDVKLNVMVDLLCQKFTNSELRQKLLATEDAILIEGNTWGDTFWGVCKGVGKNHLGKILMAIRKELQERENDA